ncbi:flavodoxin family protein BilS [Massilimicrobiota sp. An134]|uniref:flavodoxin family protein BilS n=1 Tax=Massilimicrobiota sp. An134 TaxID=1965557 RepID=UPI000B39F8BD|nr:flavodoxin family protein BilS [Massilimicrobiota sp. An134]OUQ29712.1 hypothetical protein B5E79_06405 [Massilimicrobiota sp. An134]
MQYAIIFSSPTGNTQMLAETIKNHIKGECCYYGKADLAPLMADYIFVGFWTDKGTCDESIQDYLKQLHHQKIFLFGTAGFGGSQEYFDGILKRVQTNIADDNQIVGQFMCQGKMPMSVRQRYEQMAQKQPEKFIPMIENFDQALSHPSLEDLQSFIQQLSVIQ